MADARRATYRSTMTDLAPFRDHTESSDDAPHVDEPPVVDDRVRLYRRRTRRVVAGVAGGLSDRFDVDPNIVRVVFVVLSLAWGLGAVIYLAMWAFVPRVPAGTDDAADVPEPTRPWLAVALLLAVVVIGLLFVATVSGLPRFGGGLAAIWLLFLGGVAIVALRVASPRLTFQRFLALGVLSVLTVVIVVVGAFLGFLAATGVPVTGGDGVRTWQPTSLASVAHSYRTEFGQETVDLSGVPFPSTGFDVTASVSVGKLVVDVPTDAVVDLRTHVGIGTVDYLDVSGGDFTPLPRGATAASARRLPHLTLDADVGVGSILIERTSATMSIQ